MKPFPIFPVTLADIASARWRIAPYFTPSPLRLAPTLAKNAWLKLENLNPMRSFKVRGALNAMLTLREQNASLGAIVAASSGNHAQGVAYAGRLLGIDTHIFMSTMTAKRKIAGVREQGGGVILHGATYDAAESAAHEYAQKHGMHYLSPYADPLVIAGGGGTIGLEVLHQLPTVERVIVPVGGGGLISGIAVALKSIRPSVEIIGVNAAASPDMLNIVQHQTHPLSFETLADALPGVIEPTSPTRAITAALVDRLVMVDEDAIAFAMRWIIEQHGMIGEGGGVVGIAALLSGVIAADDQPTVVVVSGGNVDMDVLKRIMNAGDKT